jgi:hypothetical protein
MAPARQAEEKRARFLRNGAKKKKLTRSRCRHAPHAAGAGDARKSQAEHRGKGCTTKYVDTLLSECTLEGRPGERERAAAPGRAGKRGDSLCARQHLQLLSQSVSGGFGMAAAQAIVVQPSYRLGPDDKRCVVCRVYFSSRAAKETHRASPPHLRGAAGFRRQRCSA